jgi:hypothetical protein
MGDKHIAAEMVRPLFDVDAILLHRAGLVDHHRVVMPRSMVTPTRRFPPGCDRLIRSIGAITPTRLAIHIW